MVCSFCHIGNCDVKNNFKVYCFFGLVMPVGIIRKSMGQRFDAIEKMEKWKSSVFIVRDHEITYEDIQHPY